MVEKEKFEEKEKPKRSERDWGWFKWFLLIWAFSSLRTLEGIIELQASLNDYYAQGLDFVWRVGYLQGLVIWDVMSIILVITGCWGLWKFRKWGLYGLIIVMSASLIIALITPMVIDNGLGTVNYILLGIRLIPIAILYYGVRDKYHYLT